MSPVMTWADRRKISSEATTFTPLEANTYSFVIKDPAKVSEKDGWPRYAVQPVVEDGPRANAKVFHTFYTSEKPNGMRMFYDAMEILGLSADFFDNVGSDAEICNALQGKRFTAEVFHEEYNGKLQQRLRKIGPPVGTPSATIGGGIAAGAGGAFSAPPVQQFAPAQQQSAVQQYAPVQQAVQQPVAQQYAPAQAAAPAQQGLAADNPWGNTVAAPPAPPFA